VSRGYLMHARLGPARPHVKHLMRGRATGPEPQGLLSLTYTCLATGDPPVEARRTRVWLRPPLPRCRAPARLTGCGSGSALLVVLHAWRGRPSARAEVKTTFICWSFLRRSRIRTTA
jgi:hypothetical protein